jgi:hypothetical protein
MEILLIIEVEEIDGLGLVDPPVCRLAARGHLEVVRLSVQQGERLDINGDQSYDTAIFIAARDGDMKMVRVPLHHDQIDVVLMSRWLEGPLIWQLGVGISRS